MKSFQLPGLEREPSVTYQGIREEMFEETKSEMQKTLRKKLRDNEMREARSIRYASDFVTTPPFDEE